MKPDSDNFDEENYNFAKEIFEIEEGRKPNMNNEKDMFVVATLEVGVRYTRLKLEKHEHSS